MTELTTPTELETTAKGETTLPAAEGDARCEPTIEVHQGPLVSGSENTGFVKSELSRLRSPYVTTRDPRWLSALGAGLKHQQIQISARRDAEIVGSLPLILMKSRLFGRHLISLPYVNWSGVIADDETVATALVDRAVALADEHDVRYLELRHEQPLSHPALTECVTSKVHMRLALPDSADELWTKFKPKVRNQIRKAEKHNLTVHWGGAELLDEYYKVFSVNMRDLGTPVYGKTLFASMLNAFHEDAELCVVRLENKPIAAAILVHSQGVTEVPSASSLRAFNTTNANMLMYWNLLQKAIERQSAVFDFGRSSAESNTYRFKKQWGAKPEPAAWQYYVRQGAVDSLRPENAKFSMAVRVWQKLPLGLTRLIGPSIVRGIP